MMSRKIILLITSVLLGAHHRADAALVINVLEVGNSVEFTGSGSADMDDLIQIVVGSTQAEVQSGGNGDGPIVVVGANASFRFFEGLSGPTSFGTSTSRKSADLSSGDLFGIFGVTPTDSGLFLPPAYVSESMLMGSMTINNATFASLEMDPGTYVWTWGSGANADSLTLNIGNNIPEPTTATLGLLGMAGLLVRRRRAA